MKRGDDHTLWKWRKSYVWKWKKEDITSFQTQNHRLFRTTEVNDIKHSSCKLSISVLSLTNVDNRTLIRAGLAWPKLREVQGHDAFCENLLWTKHKIRSFWYILIGIYIKWLFTTTFVNNNPDKFKVSWLNIYHLKIKKQSNFVLIVPKLRNMQIWHASIT